MSDLQNGSQAPKPYPPALVGEIAALQERVDKLVGCLDLVDTSQPIYARVERTWGPETMWSWLTRPQLKLGYEIPLVLICKGQPDEVSAILDFIDGGAYA